MIVPQRCFAVILSAAVCFHASAAIQFVKDTTQLSIRTDDKPFATYVWSDPKIPRPYFANVHAPNGVQVTRSYPIDPVLNKDNDDHDTFHPGLWLSFGDANGLDFWRNKARVRNLKFVQEPTSDDDHGAFTVLNVYEPTEGPSDNTFYETCRYDFFALDIGWYLIAQSAFQSGKGDITFGDQEEMGFGARIQTPLTVKFGSGTILNTNKGRNELGTWGYPADWCSYYGKAGDTFCGVTLMPGPKNFRASWYHSRDYGLVVANPFGKKAMTGAKRPEMQPDATAVPKGEVMRLTFAAFVFASSAEPDNATAYEWFNELLAQCEPPKAPLELAQDVPIVE